ncbi:MAG: hypothetical protein ACO1SV_16180 [Fimbriimonas sp.]
MTDDERRKAAFAAVERARSSGDSVELGRALTTLAQLAKQIGLDDGESAFSRAASYGAEAVQVLRDTDDLAALSSALRAAAVPFTVGVDVDALREEALAVARRSGDRAEEAWSLFAIGNAKMDAPMLREAEAIFAEIGDRYGLATVRQSFAFWQKHSDAERSRALEVAAEEYLAVGRNDEAHKAFVMAAFCLRARPLDEKRALLHRALDLAPRPVDRALIYRNLAWNRDEAKDPAAGAEYRRLEDALDVEAYGSRAKRLESDLEILYEDLEGTYGRRRKALKAKIRTVETELRTLSEG